MTLLIKKTMIASLASISLTSWFDTAPINADKSPFGDKYWTTESVTVQPAIDLDMDGKPDKDLLILIEACERDDADQYRADGTINTDRGKLICEEDENDDEETGIWTYDPKTQKVIIKKHDTRKPTEAIVKEATANRIILISTLKSNIGTHAIQTILKAK